MKKDEISKLLNEALSENLTDKERGEIYSNFAMLYLKSVGDINKQYEEVLDRAIAVLKKIDSAQ